MASQRLCLCPLAASPPARLQRSRRAAGSAVRAAAKGRGFGSAADDVQQPPVSGAGGYWNGLKISLAELAAKPKSRHPVLLAGDRSAMLWLAGDRLYCTAATGTAFQYPLVDAELLTLAGSGTAAVRCTLDGCVYALDTGAVVEWCPREESSFSLRNFLSAAKAKETPVPLPVYATRISPFGEIEAFFPVSQ